MDGITSFEITRLIIVQVSMDRETKLLPNFNVSYCTWQLDMMQGWSNDLHLQFWVRHVCPTAIIAVTWHCLFEIVLTPLTLPFFALDVYWEVIGDFIMTLQRHRICARWTGIITQNIDCKCLLKRSGKNIIRRNICSLWGRNPNLVNFIFCHKSILLVG